MSLSVCDCEQVVCKVVFNIGKNVENSHSYELCLVHGAKAVVCVRKTLSHNESPVQYLNEKDPSPTHTVAVVYNFTISRNVNCRQCSPTNWAIQIEPFKLSKLSFNDYAFQQAVLGEVCLCARSAHNLVVVLVVLSRCRDGSSALSEVWYFMKREGNHSYRSVLYYFSVPQFSSNFYT